MKLEKATISNFRNIVHAEYNFSNRNVLCGPNKMGKTNTISAIYWALTGYQIDGSADSMKNKPFEDTKQEVSVELQFDSFKMKRTYKENWVKTRGSNESVLSGHKQDIYIDDVKYSIKNGEDKIKSLLGLNINLTTSKFDLLRCIIDPYYIVSMSNQYNWKILREFIVELVGDITPGDVFNALPNMAASSKDFLGSKNYDTALCSKFLKSQISKVKEEIQSTESKIEGFQEAYIKPSMDDCLNSRKQIAALNDQIEKIKEDQRNYVNPNLRLLNEKLEQTKRDLLQSQTNDAVGLQTFNGLIDDNIQKIQEELNRILPVFNQNRNNKNSLENQLFEKRAELRKMMLERDEKETQRSMKLKEYHELNNKEFEYNAAKLDAVVCPECGCVINADVLDKEQKSLEDARKSFEIEKQLKLEGIVKLGTDLRNEIDNLNYGINELEKIVNKTQEELSSVISEYQAADIKVKDYESQIAVLRSRRKVSANDSQNTSLLKGQLMKLQSDIENEKKKKTDIDYDSKIHELQDKINECRKVLDQEHDYNRGQELIHKFEYDLQLLGDKQCEYEQLLIDIEEFIKKKLELLDSNVKKVFGSRLTFVLVEANIKEGSFNEVCKPTVLDKQTMLIDGSGAEKIQAGIYIIECIKKKMGLSDLPIIFDECDKLDSSSLNNLITDSQIISTRVDDVNYNKVTLVTA